MKPTWMREKLQSLLIWSVRSAPLHLLLLLSLLLSSCASAAVARTAPAAAAPHACGRCCCNSHCCCNCHGCCQCCLVQVDGLTHVVGRSRQTCLLAHNSHVLPLTYCLSRTAPFHQVEEAAAAAEALRAEVAAGAAAAPPVAAQLHIRSFNVRLLNGGRAWGGQLRCCGGGSFTRHQKHQPQPRRCSGRRGGPVAAVPLVRSRTLSLSDSPLFSLQADTKEHKAERKKPQAKMERVAKPGSSSGAGGSGSGGAGGSSGSGAHRAGKERGWLVGGARRFGAQTAAGRVAELGSSACTPCFHPRPVDCRQARCGTVQVGNHVELVTGGLPSRTARWHLSPTSVPRPPAGKDDARAVGKYVEHVLEPLFKGGRISKDDYK